MQIQILYFGILKDLVACEREMLEVVDGSLVEDVIRLLRTRASNSKSDMWSSLAVAVNREYASLSTILHNADELALLPPVSGGSLKARDCMAIDPRVELFGGAIPSAQLLDEIKAGPDGAVVVFDGIVRNNTRGRQTLYLVYEGYEAMALEQMRSLVDEALLKFAVRDVILVHRLGKLEIGETSVLIAVASAHRGAAFDACRWLIDTLKRTVPIWKKEHFVDGAVWADGEPFPEGIALSAAPVQLG